MTIHRFHPGPEPRRHMQELAEVLTNAKPRDTLEIDGWCDVFDYPVIADPIHLRKAGNEGGFRLHGNAAVVVGPGIPALEPQAKAFDPVKAGRASFVYLPGPSEPPVKVGSYVFLWSEDALSGVLPHMNGRQLPGECHRVVEVEPAKLDARGGARVWLAESIRDDMTSSPRFVVANLSPWAGLCWDVDFLGVDRTAGRAAAFNGLPGLRMTASTESAGDLAFNCPDVHVDARIRGQVDEANHYGVVIGPWSSNFTVVGSGYGCRHVQTTSGVPYLLASSLVQCGTPWGVVSMRVRGRYQAALDTHASGRGIVYDRCHVEILPTPKNDGGVGIKVRARDTLIRDCTILGANPGQSGMIGVESWATGCKVVGLTHRHLWIPTNKSGPGTISDTATA